VDGKLILGSSMKGLGSLHGVCVYYKYIGHIVARRARLKVHHHGISHRDTLDEEWFIGSNMTV
jgi:hypothetical protein